MRVCEERSDEAEKARSSRCAAQTRPFVTSPPPLTPLSLSRRRVGGTLARTETVADETIFRAAKDGKGGKSGASATKSYRNLSMLRENFER